MNKLYDNGVSGWLSAICDKMIHSWFRDIDLYSNNSDHNIKWNDRNYKIYDSNDNDIYGYLKHYTINTNTDPDLIQIHNGIIKLNSKFYIYIKIYIPIILIITSSEMIGTIIYMILMIIMVIMIIIFIRLEWLLFE